MSQKREKSTLRSVLTPILHTSNQRVCFYGLSPGHLIADCAIWNRKQGKPTSVACISTEAVGSPKPIPIQNKYGATFHPFIWQGMFSCLKQMRTYRKSKVLNLGEQTFCGSYVVVCAIELTPVSVPLLYILKIIPIWVGQWNGAGGCKGRIEDRCDRSCSVWW